MRERLTQLWLRLTALARRRQLDRDIDDELAFHLAMREEANRQAGQAPADAHAGARRQFGSPLRVKESLRELWLGGTLDRTLQDLRFAARSARRQPGFTAVVILTLALGIGATTAMFSIVDAVLLRPFSFPQPDRLVMVWEMNRPRGIATFTSSLLNFISLRQDATAFRELGAWSPRDDNRSDGPRAEQVSGAMASASFFRALALEPTLGRFFREGEDTAGQPHVAVLGYEYWQRAFGGDRQVLGRALTINGEPWTIVGVAPPLRGAFRADVWRPAVVQPGQDRGDHDMYVIGRLHDGQSIARAEAELQTIASRLAAAYPDTNRDWSNRVDSLLDFMVATPTQRGLIVLLSAVGLLLAIACVNATNLMLARSTGRQREMATRLALGASRARLMRQLLTESSLFACAGGVLGLLIAAWTLAAMQTLYPIEIAGLAEARINSAAFAFAVVVSIVTTIVVGLAPALQWSRVSFQGGLKQSTRGATDAPQTRRLRHVLVVAEIALALVLLVGAGLLLRSFDRLRSVPLGFSPAQVLTAKIGLHADKYEQDDAYTGFIDRVLANLSQQPGVAAVGMTSSVPFGGGYTAMQTRREADAGLSASHGLLSGWRVVAGDYFKAMGIPLLKGRAFRETDNRSIPRVAIISEALARKLWPGEDPIGRRMLVSDSQRPYEIVGVVGRTRLTSLAKDEELAMYFHYRQFSWASMTIAIRAARDPSSLPNAVRAAVASIDREQPVFELRTMTELIDHAADTPRMNAALLTMFAVLALALSAMGVYGVMSYAAAQRTNEIGLRLALGAEPRDVLTLVWRNGLTLSAIGLTVGLLVALFAGRALQSILYEVSPKDPVTYATVLGVMTTVALIACYLPARRAMRIDPIVALRHE